MTKSGGVAARPTLPVLGIRAERCASRPDGKDHRGDVLSDDNLLATAAANAASGWQVPANLGPVPAGWRQSTTPDSSVSRCRPTASSAALYWLGERARTRCAGRPPTAMTDAGSSGRNSRINAMNADGTVMVGWGRASGLRQPAATVRGQRRAHLLE